MGRKNNRVETYEPLDLTALTQPRKPGPPTFTLADRRQRAEDQRQREEQQRSARLNRGIDWSICLVPGCGADIYRFGRTMTMAPEWRDHKVSLPLCLDHLWVAFRHANDETYLHRQLKPARARGREWYDDGPILADFVAKAIEQHGEPEAKDYWSRPATPALRPHRSSRR